MKRRKILLLLASWCLSLLIVHAQNKHITTCEYWIDSNEKQELAVNASQVAFTIDASQVSEGLHTLSYRVKDNAGVYSPLQTWMFIRTALQDASIENKVTSVEYWIDSNEKQELAVNASEVAFALDASHVGEGLHTLSYRVKDNIGMYSPLQTWMFIRTALQDATTENVVTSVEYWFDGKTNETHKYAITGESASFSVDASALKQGAHTLSYRVKDTKGRYSMPQTWAFYRNVPTATKIVWYKYWWNDHEDKAVKENVKNDGDEYVFMKEVVVPEYAKTDGFSRRSAARLSIVFCDDMGNVSQLVCADVAYPDVIPPVTTITTDKEEATESVTLKWSADEDEVLSYNIYYSENDQPYVLWMPNTTKEMATFKGQAGSTYKFTVTAHDKAGNRERLDESKYVKVEFKSN